VVARACSTKYAYDERRASSSFSVCAALKTGAICATFVGASVLLPAPLVPAPPAAAAPSPSTSMSAPAAASSLVICQWREMQEVARGPRFTEQ